MFNAKYINFLEREVDELKEEIKRLQQENHNLQAAIVAQRAPMAYEHYAKPYPEDKSNKEKLDNETRFFRRYAQEVEQPLFNDVDEMLEVLGARAGIPKSSSLHNNSES